MTLVSKITLYFLGIILLAFGNRKSIDNLLGTLGQINPWDENKNLEKGFQVLKLEYDRDRDTLMNNTPYFEIVRIDTSLLDTPSSNTVKTTIESDHAETASDSQ